MSFFCRSACFALLITVAACSGGGNSGSGGAAGPAWPRFRHDASNSGQAAGGVFTNAGTIKGVVDLKGPVSASPAISSDDTIYIGTEACTASDCATSSGTFAAVGTDPIEIRWTTQENARCVGDPQLGAMISSPAVYTLGATTSIFVGSQNNRVHGFSESSGATQPTAQFCFDPTQLTGPQRVNHARFRSSPVLTTSSVSSTVEGIFIGAEVEVDSGMKEGRIYAIANDGSLRWEFPRPGAARIAPVSSSPSIGLGSLLFLDDAGWLYALSVDGNLKWTRNVGPVHDAEGPFAISPVSSTTGIFVTTLDGTMIAFNPDGSERWRRADSSREFRGSLALGDLPLTPVPTETPTPLLSPTPVPTATGGATASPTVTITPVPFLSTTALFGVTRNGELVVFEAAAPTPAAPPAGGSVEGEVIGSPALSGDGFLVFASSTAAGGWIYVIDLLTGEPPPTPTGTPSPVAWPKAIDGTGIVSSPVLANDGTIWTVTSDGKLYAIGSN